MVFSSPPLGFICSPTGQTPDLFSHSDPKLFGVWCYFYLHLTHLCSIFVILYSSDPLLSPIAPLFVPVNPPIHRDSESAYSFYFYLPLCLLLGMVRAQDLP